MAGGDREVTLSLIFGAKRHREKGGTRREWRTTATFHEADIQVDAILSHPWLEEKKLGVFPHLRSLAHLSDPSCF